MAERYLHESGLRYFHEVVRTGSITAAAQRLHIAASAISRQITSLEQAVGTPLFERHARGMVATAEGEVLASYIRKMLLDTEKVLEDIRALRELRSGRVRIVASEAFTYDLLPPLIAEFQSRHEGIAFELTTATPDAISARVRSGDADIGIKFGQGVDADVQVQLRQPAPVIVVMRPDHPMAGRAALRLESLRSCALALPTADTTLRQMFDIACNNRQLRLEPIFVANSAVTLHNFVIASGSIAVTSLYSAKGLVDAGRLTAVPLRDPVLDLRHLEVQTLAGRSLPVAVSAFLDVLERHLGR